MCKFCEFDHTEERKIVIYGNETVCSNRMFDTTAYFILAHSEMLDNTTELVCALYSVPGAPIYHHEKMEIFYCPMCGRKL